MKMIDTLSEIVVGEKKGGFLAHDVRDKWKPKKFLTHQSYFILQQAQ